MTEKELINKIKELSQVKPNQNWVFLTKNRILGEVGKLSELGFLRELKGVLREDKGALREFKGVLREDKGALREFKGVLREDKGALRELKGVLREDKGALRELKGVLREDKGALRELKGVLRKGVLREDKGWLREMLLPLNFLRGWGLKPAYVGLLTLFIIFGLFGFAQNSLPGDILYPVKKAGERSQTFFASEQEKQQMSFELAQKRLEELTKIVEENQTKKLAPAINEFQASVSRIGTVRDKEEVRRVVEISRTAKALSETYGVAGLEEALKMPEMESLIVILESLIEDLGNRALTIKQDLLLDRMKELVDEGQYSEALELYSRNQ